MSKILPDSKSSQNGFIDVISAIVLAVLLVGIPVTTYLAQHKQDTRKYASFAEGVGGGGGKDDVTSDKEAEEKLQKDQVLEAAKQQQDEYAADLQRQQVLQAAQQQQDEYAAGQTTTTSGTETGSGFTLDPGTSFVTDPGTGLVMVSGPEDNSAGIYSNSPNYIQYSTDPSTGKISATLPNSSTKSVTVDGINYLVGEDGKLYVNPNDYGKWVAQTIQQAIPKAPTYNDVTNLNSNVHDVVASTLLGGVQKSAKDINFLLTSPKGDPNQFGPEQQEKLVALIDAVTLGGLQDLTALTNSYIATNQQANKLGLPMLAPERVGAAVPLGFTVANDVVMAGDLVKLTAPMIGSKLSGYQAARIVANPKDMAWVNEAKKFLGKNPEEFALLKQEGKLPTLQIGEKWPAQVPLAEEITLPIGQEGINTVPLDAITTAKVPVVDLIHTVQKPISPWDDLLTKLQSYFPTEQLPVLDKAAVSDLPVVVADQPKIPVLVDDALTKEIPKPLKDKLAEAAQKAKDIVFPKAYDPTTLEVPVAPIPLDDPSLKFPELPVESGPITPHKTTMLGEGGFGSVWEDPAYPHLVIKEFSDPAAAASQANTLEKLAGKYGNPVLVQYDGGNTVIMEKIQGTTLDKYLNAGGTITPNQANDFLTRLHQQIAETGIGHGDLVDVNGDLKFNNIIVTPAGELRPIDPWEQAYTMSKAYVLTAGIKNPQQEYAYVYKLVNYLVGK